MNGESALPFNANERGPGLRRSPAGRLSPYQLLLLRLPSNCRSSMNRLMKFKNNCRLS